MFKLLRAVVSQARYSITILKLFCVLIKMTRQLFTKVDGRNNMEKMVTARRTKWSRENVQRIE